MEDYGRKGGRKFLADTVNRIQFKRISLHLSRHVCKKMFLLIDMLKEHVVFLRGIRLIKSIVDIESTLADLLLCCQF